MSEKDERESVRMYVFVCVCVCLCVCVLGVRARVGMCVTMKRECQTKWQARQDTLELCEHTAKKNTTARGPSHHNESITAKKRSKLSYKT